MSVEDILRQFLLELRINENVINPICDATSSTLNGIISGFGDGTQHYHDFLNNSASCELLNEHSHIITSKQGTSAIVSGPEGTGKSGVMSNHIWKTTLDSTGGPIFFIFDDVFNQENPLSYMREILVANLCRETSDTGTSALSRAAFKIEKQICTLIPTSTYFNLKKRAAEGTIPDRSQFKAMIHSSTRKLGLDHGLSNLILLRDAFSLHSTTESVFDSMGEFLKSKSRGSDLPAKQSSDELPSGDELIKNISSLFLQLGMPLTCVVDQFDSILYGNTEKKIGTVGQILKFLEPLEGCFSLMGFRSDTLSDLNLCKKDKIYTALLKHLSVSQTVETEQVPKHRVEAVIKEEFRALIRTISIRSGSKSILELWRRLDRNYPGTFCLVNEYDFYRANGDNPITIRRIRQFVWLACLLIAREYYTDPVLLRFLTKEVSLFNLQRYQDEVRRNEFESRTSLLRGVGRDIRSSYQDCTKVKMLSNSPGPKKCLEYILQLLLPSISVVFRNISTSILTSHKETLDVEFPGIAKYRFVFSRTVAVGNLASRLRYYHRNDPGISVIFLIDTEISVQEERELEHLRGNDSSFSYHYFFDTYQKLFRLREAIKKCRHPLEEDYKNDIALIFDETKLFEEIPFLEKVFTDNLILTSLETEILMQMRATDVYTTELLYRSVIPPSRVTLKKFEAILGSLQRRGYVSYCSDDTTWIQTCGKKKFCCFV